MTAPTPGSGEWRALVDEPVIDPEERIVDPHHHLWPSGPLPYDLADLLADVGSGHRIERTVFMECRAAYPRTARPSSHRWARPNGLPRRRSAAAV